MKKVKILTDSCCDLPKKIRDKYDIDYFKMRLDYKGKEVVADLDWEFASAREFFDYMRDGNKITPKPVPIREFENKFREYVDKGYDIVYIACASKLSTAFATASSVANELAKEYPNNKIICVDSLNACMGEGMLVIEACELKELGYDAEEIADKIISERNYVHQIGTFNNLDLLKEAGKVRSADAFFGNLFKIKPIVTSSDNGEDFDLKVVKGRQESLKEIVKMLKERLVDSENQVVYIMHSDCLIDAMTLQEEIISQIKCRDILIYSFGPVTAAAVGHGLVALYAFEKDTESME